MKIKTIFIFTIAALILAVPIAAQDAGQPGFVIKLKNGSTMRGRTLSRDESTGKLRLAMTEAGGEAKATPSLRRRTRRRSAHRPVTATRFE